jgi:hypothetical protein
MYPDRGVGLTCAFALAFESSPNNSQIVPSADIRYRLADLTAALSSGGHAPVLQCDNGTLEAVVYPVHVVGNLAAFAPAGQKNVASSCPSEGIM